MRCYNHGAASGCWGGHTVALRNMYYGALVSVILVVIETVSVGAFWNGAAATHRFHHSSRSGLQAAPLEESNTKMLSKKKKASGSSSKNSRLKSFRTAQQQRQKHKESRRPKYYWEDLGNVQLELEAFWTHCGVDIFEICSKNNNSGNKKVKDATAIAIAKNGKGQKQPPLCIPNEALLNYFGRHDLRAAIATYGGREELAYLLMQGTSRLVTIMPGKWSEAVASSIELQILLRNQTHAEWLSKDEAPTPTKHQHKLKQLATQAEIDAEPPRNKSKKKWAHQEERKPLGYWNQQKVVEELYDYLDEYKELHGRPSIWFPRPSELKNNGRDDLATAMRRFGGSKRIAEIARLIPFREWNFFEGQYELLLLLKHHLDETSVTKEVDEKEKYKFFPTVLDIRNAGNDRLYLLMQYYGGSKFLSSRLGMSTKRATGGTVAQPDLSWGKFSLEFAIRLCEFIRHLHMNVSPPIANPVISIPNPARLQRAGSEGMWLHEKIMEFGGYENVARRLYLEY